MCQQVRTPVPLKACAVWGGLSALFPAAKWVGRLALRGGLRDERGRGE